MSIASPKNRAEFKEYILSKLGAPVLQVNVADEQLDIAINDAFQYWNERSHFLGTERVYLTFPITTAFAEHFVSYEHDQVEQGPGPVIAKPGMVDELTLTTAGDQYSYNPAPAANTTNVTGTGEGLSVWLGEERTTAAGLVSVKPYNAGTGYSVGDVVSIDGSNGTAATATVAKIKTESKLFGVQDIRQQNNFITLPDDVVGVTKVFKREGMGMGGSTIGGIIPGAAIGPMFLGSLMGGQAECNSIGYDLTSYVAMREYLATLNFLFFPPIQYNFNQRTHRLFIDAKRILGGTGGDGSGYICLECMVKPSPDVFPDVWNDMWLKEYAVALTQLAWGRNLTKYNQVAMPGGITLNGESILRQAMEDIKILRDRFSMDWADPPLDLVG